MEHWHRQVTVTLWLIDSGNNVDISRGKRRVLNENTRTQVIVVVLSRKEAGRLLIIIFFVISVL